MNAVIKPIEKYFAIPSLADMLPDIPDTKDFSIEGILEGQMKTILAHVETMALNIVDKALPHYLLYP